MGGKTKQTQRTKNNAKPSSSSRSAVLLGSAVPTFVGFSAHSDGLVPFAPGFATAEQMPDSFDASIDPQLQLIMRKMSKKDPMTKKKALQEFIEFVNTSEMETIKAILPLWPKFYQNLAGDIEHNVRELAQTSLQLLVSKSKRAMAPYLKQLVPVWLVSHFDNYAPAASIASASFRETFANNANRTQEVCLHCQTEIIDYVARNLTFHTAATLSSGKGLTPEEAEQKYQRVVVCSLKALSFFVEHTKGADLSQVLPSVQSMLAHQKFWSYAKHKLPVIKAAWFELVYNLLQNAQLAEVVTESKTQLIGVCFQNIDESDPLVAPHVWGCILLLQSMYDDWYATLNFQKSVLPKLSSLLRNGFNRNCQAICPNLLPFYSKLTPESLQDVNWFEFCEHFFDDIKNSICTPDSVPKADYAIIIKSYFECLRYMLQKLNNKPERSNEENALAMYLLQENILAPIAYCLSSTNGFVKYFFQHTAALIAFWTERQTADDSNLYTELLEAFWQRIFSLITDGIEHKDVEDHFLEHVLELVHHLHSANSSLDDQRVKFAVDVTVNESAKQANDSKEDGKSTASTAAFIENELKQLVVQLVRLCIAKVKNQKSAKYISHVRRLTKMFSDEDFYAKISDETSLMATLNQFVSLIDMVQADEDACEIVVDVIFEMLQLHDKAKRFEFIRTQLLKNPQPNIQALVLQRLLSYPLCIEPEVQSMLSEPVANDIITNIARQLLVDKSKEKFNLLHKCFFQTDAGEILVSTATVDAILSIISEPLSADAEEINDMIDACGSFIAQVMPVVCSNENSSRAMRNDIFIKLFKFTIERTVDDFISEDTLWEMTTCWQDALSSEDIVIDAELLQICADIVEQRSQSADLTAAAIDVIAEAMAKFITCSTENVEDEVERFTKIDETMLALLRSNANAASAVQLLKKYALFLEALKGSVSASSDLDDELNTQHLAMMPIFRRTLLNFCTVFKLVYRKPTSQPEIQSAQSTNDEEITEDYCDPNENLLKNWTEPLYAEIMKCIQLAALADSLISCATLEATAETLMLELSEKVKLFMGNGSELVGKIKERMLEAATKECDTAACRALTFLTCCEQYAQFEENATILLMEDLCEYFVMQNALKAYVNSLQYLLPNLEPRSISVQSAIMRTEPPEMWIKAAVFRALVNNNFSGLYNEKSDKSIVGSTLHFITAIAEKQHAQKELLLYNVEIHKQSFVNVINTVEYAYLLTEVLNKFPHELTIKNWDAIRLGLSSWVLSISKSIDYYTNPKVALFTVAVYKLFAALTSFIISEKQKSSSEMLKNVIDEWESLFAREVNLVLFKAFYSLCNSPAENCLECYAAILHEITPAIELLDYSVIHSFCKNSTKITLDDLCNFLLRNLSNHLHGIRITCMHIMRQLTRFFVAEDIETFEKKSETLEGQGQIAKWHYLNRFEDYFTRYDFPIRKYLDEFSFKLTEIGNFLPIDRDEALSYLLLWDCIIYACANSPVSLRSVYTDWLNENKYEENLLHFLFRAMPVEILKNHDSKIMNGDIFRGLSWSQIADPNLSLEKYVCHVYTEVLRKLPAVVRKWWNTSQSRQKAFVDKLTTNFVSPLICSEELKAIGTKKEKHENMQVTVHTSTREVLAVYSIDEARMELVITLAPNYPLGAVKVDCGKQIGGRSSSRNVGMQLTIFLTHQNGTIFDGLTLWKNNLDKKFEGVEECYVCYTVIHQETCQLPKLTCKTCKKKFHGPCLYKWFTTSSKSTCPICRNVF